jgi:hypothetical protein
MNEPQNVRASQSHQDAFAQPHRKRVVVEKAELDEKRDKLTSFILNSPHYRGLEPVEQSRLNRQLEAMSLYSGVLGERIAAFQ